MYVGDCVWELLRLYYKERVGGGVREVHLLGARVLSGDKAVVGYNDAFVAAAAVGRRLGGYRGGEIFLGGVRSRSHVMGFVSSVVDGLVGMRKAG